MNRSSPLARNTAFKPFSPITSCAELNACRTSALTTIEYESGAISDLKRLFDEIIPVNREYAHNERWHDGNGHSHVRAALLGPSLVIPFVEGKLTLGTWQQVIYVDFDNRPRQRELVIQLIGE